MKMSKNAIERTTKTLYQLLDKDEFIANKASEAIQAKLRKDANDEEDGRWVTTENGNHMFINGEGVPTKGNPHVLAAAKGEAKTKVSSGGKPFDMSNRKVTGTVGKISDPESKYTPPKSDLENSSLYLANGSNATEEDMIDALAYLHGKSASSEKVSLRNGDYTKAEIQRALNYHSTKGLPQREREELYAQLNREAGVEKKSGFSNSKGGQSPSGGSKSTSNEIHPSPENPQKPSGQKVSAKIPQNATDAVTGRLVDSDDHWAVYAGNYIAEGLKSSMSTSQKKREISDLLATVQAEDLSEPLDFGDDFGAYKPAGNNLWKCVKDGIRKKGSFATSKQLAADIVDIHEEYKSMFDEDLDVGSKNSGTKDRSYTGGGKTSAETLQKTKNGLSTINDLHKKYGETWSEQDRSAVRREVEKTFSDAEVGTVIKSGKDQVFVKTGENEWEVHASYWDKPIKRSNSTIIDRIFPRDELSVGDKDESLGGLQSVRAGKEAQKKKALATQKKSNAKKYKSQSAKLATVKDNDLTKRLNSGLEKGDYKDVARVLKGCEVGNVIDGGNVWAECRSRDSFDIYRSGKKISGGVSASTTSKYLLTSCDNIELYCPHTWYE